MFAWGAGGAGVLNEEQQEQLIRTFVGAEQSATMKVRLQAALILGNAGDEYAVPSLVACLSDPDYPVRGACALALGKLDDLRGVEPLVKLLDDREPFVHQEALRSLKLLARAEALPYVRSARESVSPRARQALVDLAQGMTDPAAADALLVDLLGDDAPNVRTAVDATIAGLSQKRVSGVVAAGLDHGNYRVRARAAALAGERGVAEVERLGAMLANPTELPEVHGAARGAIRRLSAAVDVAALAAIVRPTGGDKNGRARALGILAARGGAEVYDVLVAALDDPDEFVRGTAATALADLGDPRAVDRLKVALAAPQNARLARIIHGSIRRLGGSAKTP